MAPQRKVLEFKSIFDIPLKNNQNQWGTMGFIAKRWKPLHRVKVLGDSKNYIWNLITFSLSPKSKCSVRINYGKYIFARPEKIGKMRSSVKL